MKPWLSEAIWLSGSMALMRLRFIRQRKPCREHVLNRAQNKSSWDDSVACFNIQFPDYFRSEPLDLSVAGTTADLELSPASDSVLYGSNVIGELEACMQRRLASGFSDWRIEGEIRILPSR